MDKPHIYTIEIWSDKAQFDKLVNQSLDEGYKLKSSSCGCTDAGDTIYQAIMTKE
ncbi:MAG: hypothetical protein GY861_04870 [bacterium]|nr:hypothetical protein [bacterium]